MPDLTLCQGNSCKIKEECFRYTAKPKEFNQSYTNFHGINEKCEYFIDNKKFVINKDQE